MKDNLYISWLIQNGGIPMSFLLIPGSFCSPELLAHIVYEKYAKAVPLHRQEKDLASKHIPLLKATMSNWILTAAEK